MQTISALNRTYYIFAAGIALIALAVNAADYKQPKFASTISGFEKQDAKTPPPHGAVLFIGSSSIRRWHNELADDMAPLTIIKRGFGGSNMHEVLHYTDRIVIPYAPRAIVLYEGDNDTSQGVPAATIIKTFQEFVKQVHTALPKTRIYVLSVKPSIARVKIWDKAAATNDALKKTCADNPLLTYVDVATPILKPDGTPRPDLFVGDNLHLNRAGYVIWKKIVRDALKREFETEPKR